ITAIYLNPVFEAYSLHKYDASTYHHIDNNFGPDAHGDLELLKRETNDPATWNWSAADDLFLRLIREAHNRGIRIIIDGVFNHCGTRFWAFQDVIKNQQRSKYADWFDVVRWDDPSTRENEFDYKGWWGGKSLPEFKEGEQSFSKLVWEYFFDITSRWMDPNGDGDPSDGIDGWRLDVANDVSPVFWRKWRNHVKSINPDAFIVGEIWDDASRWLSGDQFDAVMNYRFAFACVRFFVNSASKSTTVSEFDVELAAIRRNYREETHFVLQNLIDSHDTDRLPSMIVNPNRDYDRKAGPRDNPDYNLRKPRLEEQQIQRLVALFQMTYLGAPMIYYGDEAGMWGADDPDDRKPMVWDDLTYQSEKSHPLPGKSRSDDPVKFDKDLFKFYRNLIKIRKEQEALRRGSFAPLLKDDKKRVYVFQRRTTKDVAIVALNNDMSAQSVTLSLDGQFQDQLTGKTIRSIDNRVTLTMEPKTGMLLTPMMER
ncbi:MAG TPA: glycoside hydrolase family 13 protein, partial [Bacteroidota bacterium]|nr:glycoside hydrolase family 13 protein [Bacteroidota bacterium]